MMATTMAMRQPENWLYEIWQKGQDSPCYVMVPNAKDLVKSHLMIAVREEVEVLKEKISELMDKINQLETENTLLKSNLSQETLQQLQQIQSAGNGSTTNVPQITAGPTATTTPQQNATVAGVGAASSANGTAANSPAAASNTTIESVVAAAAAAASNGAAATTVLAANGTAAAAPVLPAPATTNGPMS